jgi:hypothetical protein
LKLLELQMNMVLPNIALCGRSGTGKTPIVHANVFLDFIAAAVYRVGWDTRTPQGLADEAFDIARQLVREAE